MRHIFNQRNLTIFTTVVNLFVMYKNTTAIDRAISRSREMEAIYSKLEKKS